MANFKEAMKRALNDAGFILSHILKGVLIILPAFAISFLVAIYVHILVGVLATIVLTIFTLSTLFHYRTVCEEKAKEEKKDA